MSSPVSVRRQGAVAFIAIDHPPVNGLSHAVRAGLYDAFTSIRDEPSITGVVLHGLGRCFSAGGDIREFDTPAATAAPGLSKHVHPVIESCGKMVVAAIHGYALGGGLETAMVCHTRVATPDARLGLPEAKLGVIPLSGTQRLPRLVGVEAAIAMILSGDDVRAEDAPAGLIDSIAEENALLERGAALALTAPPTLIRHRPYPAGSHALYRAARSKVDAGAYPPFSAHLLDAMQAGAGVSFDDGLRAARDIYDTVVASPAARTARAAFLQRSAQSKEQA